MRFCEWLSGMKDKEGYSFSSLAQAIDSSPQNVRLHVIGRTLPHPIYMDAYFKAFGVPRNKWLDLNAYFKDQENVYRKENGLHERYTRHAKAEWFMPDNC